MVSFFYNGALLCSVSAKESSVAEILAIKELLAAEKNCKQREIEVCFGGDKV